MLATAELDKYIRPLTKDEFKKITRHHRIIDQHLVELMAGRLINMTCIGASHLKIEAYLHDVFNKKLPSSLEIIRSSHIDLNEYYVPKPDIVITTGEDYFPLIVEVTDSSFTKTFIYDNKIKISVYAKFNVPEVWIIDVDKQHLIRYASPINGIYEKIEMLDTLEKLQNVSLFLLPGFLLDLSNLFKL